MPGSMTAEQAKARGVHLAWVLGRQEGFKWLQRSLFDYGMEGGNDVAFGCEAEAAVLAALARQLRANGMAEEEIKDTLLEYAVRGPVTAEKVAGIARLFDAFGIGCAALQSFGRELEKSV